LLDIELTEATLTDDPETAIAAVRALRALGVRVVLDGFGTGDTPASLLQRCPLSAVKIDRSVLRGALRHEAGAAWLRGLVALVRAMRLECLAVGVETEEQRALLEAAGCQSWQGFLHAPALDPQRLPGWCQPAGGAAAAA
jgi:EAL domain-containing protein (putative c-di-GMP-specific phosphodiesterase class I)